NSIIVHYDETALARWMEQAVSAAGVVPLLGAVLREVAVEGRRLTRLRLATRHGDVEVAARGFVDASGDAVLAWLAGLEVREPAVPVFGTMMFTLEGVDEQAPAGTREQIHARLREKGADYGLARQDGFLFSFPGRDLCLVNMTHLPTPLDPVAMSRAVLEGRAQVDRLVAFLHEQFPERLGRARVRSYGQPGVRQTRWIVGAHSLGVEEVRAGTRFPDAVARCSWPIEGHQDESSSHWEEFGDDHMHYVPLASMLPPGADNLVAAGRCIDGDVGALSSVRVMGPCIAMGAAAVHALDLAGAGSVHGIDFGVLRGRIADNLERRDPGPTPEA
ncbi:FAD-dependent oxidoreductase, partial [Arenibaculum sp.]|uniref:FAD-dependent oxidoreductase n=1 Tax=Arenibaculum sp. TaxID=2865862 RepID=UPI002E0EE6E1|nr:FAD-dependent oxidoreductase [Arenibaculum sp.]